MIYKRNLKNVKQYQDLILKITAASDIGQKGQQEFHHLLTNERFRFGAVKSGIFLILTKTYETEKSFFVGLCI